MLKKSILFLSGKRGSNPRPSVWQTDVLPAVQLPHHFNEFIYDGVNLTPHHNHTTIGFNTRLCLGNLDRKNSI